MIHINPDNPIEIFIDEEKKKRIYIFISYCIYDSGDCSNSKWNETIIINISLNKVIIRIIKEKITE